MVQEVLLSISLIVGISAIFTIIARIIKQPPIIAYIFAGVLVGPLFLNLVGSGGTSPDIMLLFAHIGIAFLLFIVGLSLDFRVLKEVGGVSAIAGFIEIFLTGGIGFLIAWGIGFNNLTAIYIGTAVAFSSTVVIVKILSDKKEIDTLHGRIAIGILIVEDFVAALALMIIPLLSHGGNFNSILINILVVICLIAGVFLFSMFLLGKILYYLAKNQEVLFLFGIAWALTLACLFDYLGFSLEIGALIAGMSLASSKYTLELGGKMKPLRDFFVILFFVYFGSQLKGNVTWGLFGIACLFSVFITFGKPIIIMTILRFFGYKKRTNFLTGVNLAQISEFSLIITLLGFNLGFLNQEVMSLAVLIALITIGVSSYNVYYSHAIFKRASGILGVFDGRREELEDKKEKNYDVILLGYHRIGYKILEALKKTGYSFVVVDYNPKVIYSLSKEKVDCIYGDVEDMNFLEEMEIEKAKLIISTIPDESANLSVIRKLRSSKASTIFIATAEQPRDAVDLYDHGADYVIIPHHLGGDYVASMIKEFRTSKSRYEHIGKEHLKSLRKARAYSKFSNLL